jgi:hypothetical protein
MIRRRTSPAKSPGRKVKIYHRMWGPIGRTIDKAQPQRPLNAAREYGVGQDCAEQL